LICLTLVRYLSGSRTRRTREIGQRAVIETRTPVAVHDWTLRPGASIEVPLPAAFAAYAYHRVVSLTTPD
jgi:hypothetical protein